MLEDMLRACVREFQEKWEDDLPLVEFSYNNSCKSIKMACLRLYMEENENPVVLE